MTQRMLLVGDRPEVGWLPGMVAVPYDRSRFRLGMRWVTPGQESRSWMLESVEDPQLRVTGEPAHWLCGEAREEMFLANVGFEATSLGKLLISYGRVAQAIALGWDCMEQDVVVCSDLGLFLGEVARQLAGGACGEVNAVFWPGPNPPVG